MGDVPLGLIHGNQTADALCSESDVRLSFVLQLVEAHSEVLIEVLKEGVIVDVLGHLKAGEQFETCFEYLSVDLIPKVWLDRFLGLSCHSQVIETLVCVR